jgi:hypothetical protein
METISIMDALMKRGISVPDEHKIILYNNQHFTSPIEVDPDDEYQADYACLVLPNAYPLPRNKEQIDRAGRKGFILNTLLL